ncbi:hypothetical protein [Paraburkholderia sp.]|uniref:hypothetical protein n=1 Tax=Paraburkholderia sp. TaxID=1926495 RepID=UPI003C7A7E05
MENTPLVGRNVGSFPQNIIGQPAVEIDGGIGIGVGFETAANTIKLLLCVAVDHSEQFNPMNSSVR